MTMPDQPEQALETRTCTKCLQTDTDPHHVQYVAFLHPVTGEGVDLSITKHMDCCAEDGCEICTTTMQHAQTARSDELRAFLVAQPEELKAALLDAHGIETPGHEQEA